jgi:7-cyano-7-deazaguanine synthase
VQVLLLSGGLESTAIAAWLNPTVALTIDYGQLPAKGEIWAASQVCRELSIQHETLYIDCAPVGSGLMAGRDTDPNAPVIEWWPYRNQILVTLAAAWAIPQGAKEILIGSVSGDARHVDGTAAFYELLDLLVAMQEGSIRVSAPAIDLTSEELIHRSGVAPSVLGWTHSCHVADVACGLCPGCVKHREVLNRLENET